MDKETILLSILLIFVIAFPFIIQLFIQLVPSWIGNKDAFDFNYTFNKAITYVGNEKIELEIESWIDYEGEQIQIKTADGKVYLVSSLNTILIGE